MKKINITRVEELSHWNLDALFTESQQEGYRMVTKLLREYESGKNRFNQDGEVLYVATIQDEVVGVCGLNKDPYNDKEGIGRLRHLYVLSKYRNLGIAHQLLEQIKKMATSFTVMTLRTSNPVADRFYTRNGFIKDEHTYRDSTHYILISR